MSLSDIGNVSDSTLEIMIHNAREKLLLLTELKERRRKDKRESHRVETAIPILRGKYRGQISEVTCTCGHVTKYKRPLKILDDFTCPKDK